MGAVYFLFDPMEAKWMPKCIVRVLIGWDCPGCGSQRALHALLHGDLAGAFHANALLFLLIPLILILAVLELFGNRDSTLYRRLHHPALIALLAVIILAWGIVRNFI